MKTDTQVLLRVRHMLTSGGTSMDAGVLVHTVCLLSTDVELRE